MSQLPKIVTVILCQTYNNIIIIIIIKVWVSHPNKVSYRKIHVWTMCTIANLGPCEQLVNEIIFFFNHMTWNISLYCQKPMVARLQGCFSRMNCRAWKIL